MNRSALLLPAAVLLAALGSLVMAACGGSGGNSTASGVIGPGGGTLYIPSGSLSGTELTIPPGALSTSLLLQISEGGDIAVPTFTLAGPALDLSPGGTAFDGPLTLKIPYDPDLFPEGATADDLAVLHLLEDETTVVLTPVDASGGYVTLEISSFSSVQAAVPVASVTLFEASPTLIIPNAPFTLNWTSAHASSCAIDRGVGSVSTSGSTDPSPVAVTTEYTLACQGLGGPATAKAKVTVTPPVAITSFTADPATVELGDSVTLSWTTENALSCTIDHDIGSAAPAADGSLEIVPTESGNYTLTCQGAGGPVSQQVALTVVEPVAIQSFTASPVIVAPGGEVTLAWTTSEAASCEITPGPISASPTASGSAPVTVSASTTYTLTCQGPSGPAVRATSAWVLGDVDEGMAPIPAGCFYMGPPPSTLEVCLDTFLMDVYEVTNADYIPCIDDGACAPPTRNNSYDDPGQENHPIVMVNWYDASNFCAWRGKRLPLEAEWEYAARGGLEGKNYPWGDDLPTPDKANCCGFGSGTVPVGQYPANGYGLFDVTGNVWEWVVGTSTGPKQIVRGGGPSENATWATVWYQFSHSPGDYYLSLGFRCAK